MKMRLLLACSGFLSLLMANQNLAFPKEYKEGVLYTSVIRGGVIEDIYAPKEAILALREGKTLPDQTIITMEEYANDSGLRAGLNRYIIMQKQGKEWKFQAFKADKSLNSAENTTRCLNCHKGISGEDIVFSLEAMRTYKGD